MNVISLPQGRRALRPLSCLAALVMAVSLSGGAAPARAAADAKDDAGYTIKRVYKAGDIDRYHVSVRMNMELPMGAVDMAETMVMKEQTKSAAADGSSVSLFEFENAVMTVSGMDVDLTAMLPKITSTRDKTGKSEVKVEGGNEALTSQMGDQMKQYADMGSAFLPTKPVKVGDSWDVNAADFGAKGQTVKAKTTFLSLDNVNGVRIAKMKTVMDISTQPGANMHGESTTLIDIATGKAVEMTSKVEGDTGAGKMSMQMTMKVAPADEKGAATEAVKKP